MEIHTFAIDTKHTIIGWPWPQLHTQYQAAEKWVDAQPCGSGLFPQVGKLGIRQPHADVPVSRSRRRHLP